ncbi:CheR family methyltransferase [Roseicella aquatilis]|uniref:Chemotaxis protein methyltransferase n=1 Tax=Roseicella aquatilis TaxID=2527868 RepID=A0A4R4DRI9_9PROT|nr:protein-glutamate O-methyltransferase CheR [Roseicella aquatilis]TCZ64997.1 protein-glutamate O-methyltransferase CheR [Roseicella aquatilis]
MSDFVDRTQVASTRQAATPAIGEEEFLRFQDFFYRKTGIVFGAAKRYFVDRRLVERLAATGFGSLRAYLLHLRFEDAEGEELQRLINAMTVNETYFYREEYQFRCLVSSILPEVVSARAAAEKRPVRLWSLPCSTGEEPYSLALQLLENWREVDRYDVEIVASDIDTQVLRQAQAGLYDDRAVQYLPATIKARHFTRIEQGRWQISEDLRGSVDFVQVNLSDRAAMRRHQGAFDVIFCRNLLIYFDDASRRQAVEALYDALRPGGFVCLGHSESMSRISSLFTVRKFPDAIVYQKPLA